jgi:ankyrin repeat protein
MLASQYGHADAVELLVQNGADVHANNDAPLRLARKYVHHIVEQCLIDHGADVHGWW